MRRIETAVVTTARAATTFSRLAISTILALLLPVAASAQTTSDEHPYGLDPYKPSDAALLRDYGDTLVAQTPLSELQKLDPYKPSHAALLRNLGGAIPLWGIVWYPGPVPASLSPFAPQTVSEPSTAINRWERRRQRNEFEMTTSPAVAAPAEPSSMATLRVPESNDGVWILFDSKRWISAGHTVSLDASKFERVGEYDGFPVYRRSGESEDVIYLPAREGAIAPYRLKP